MHATKAARGTPPTRETFTGFRHGLMIPRGDGDARTRAAPAAAPGSPLSLFNKNITDNDKNPLDGLPPGRRMAP